MATELRRVVKTTSLKQFTMSDNTHPSHQDPIVDRLVAALPFMTLSTRKTILTTLRVGGCITRNPRLASGLQSLRESTFLFQRFGHSKPERITGTDLVDLLIHCTSSPTLRGFLSLQVRCAPLKDRADVAAMLRESLQKELQPSQTTSRSPIMCYPMLSTYDHAASIQIHPTIPLKPFLGVAMHHKLLRWRFLCTRRLLWPRLSSKTTGNVTATNLRSSLGFGSVKTNRSTHIQKPSVTDLEHHYMTTGVEIQGPCEMRMAFRYNDLRPRLYYAVGGTCYFASKYIQSIFNLLQSEFACTDPLRRFSFDRFPLIDFTDAVFIVYDYSAFTTSLVELHKFVDQLAVFADDTEINIFDTRTGPDRIKLRHYIQNYNDVCNKEGLFDISKVVKFDDVDGCSSTGYILNHHVAGMLGVYANITGCTVLHGIVGATIAGSEDCINTIGDDAGGYYHENLTRLSKDETLDAITLIGDIARKKFIIWTKDKDNLTDEEDQSWHYTKRPIYVESGNVVQGWMPEFQIYPALMNRNDGLHTTIPTSFRQRRDKAITQTVRLFTSMYRHQDQISNSDRELVVTFTRWLFNYLLITTEGSVPCEEDPDCHLYQRPYGSRCLTIPIICVESMTEDWFDLLTERVTGDIRTMSVPMREIADDLPERLSLGLTFKSHGHKMLSMMERLSLVKKDRLVEDVQSTEDNMRYLKDFLTGRRKWVYKYTVLTDLPQWSSFPLLN